MRILTFKLKDAAARGENRYRIGASTPEGKIFDLTPLVSSHSLTSAELLDCFDLAGGFLERARVATAENRLSAALERDDIEIFAPVPRPGKLICIGLNYRDHAEESGQPIPTSPIVFSKFPTSVVGPGQPVVLPPASSQIDYEAELAFVVGRRAKNVSREDWLRYVFGYTNFNDVSARDLQFADGQWQRGKSCDSFAPMGEFVATADEISDPHNLQIRFRLNGQTLQDSNTRELIFGIPELLEFLSQTITLEPGDIVATGTPPGVGFARRPQIFMKDGDVAEVEIEGLGVLANPVRAE